MGRRHEWRRRECLMHEHDCLETDDYCLQLRDQCFDCLGLENWGSCESGRFSLGFGSNYPAFVGP